MKKNCSVSKLQVFSAPAGYIEAVSVAYAAAKMYVSERRIRQMLATGVLSGTKQSRAWRIDYPFRVRLGTRGPASQYFKDRSVVPKKRWNSSPFPNQKIKKGV